MLEALFILFLLTKNFFYFLGLAVTVAVGLTFLVIGWRNNHYRLLCRPWWRSWTCWYTYFNPLKHVYQRIKYGCSDDDAWNFDQYFLKVIPIGLTHVRESGLAPDLPEKDWNMMIEGIGGYRHIFECYEIDCPVSHNKLREDFEQAMALLTKHFDRLWI